MKIKKGCGVCAAWTGGASVMQIVREATRASAPDLFDFLFSRTSRMKMKEIVMEYQISIW